MHVTSLSSVDIFETLSLIHSLAKNPVAIFIWSRFISETYSRVNVMNSQTGILSTVLKQGDLKYLPIINQDTTEEIGSISYL